MSKGFKTLHEETFSLPFIMQTSYGDFKIETTQFYNPNKEINVKVSFSGYDYATEMLQKEVEVVLQTKRPTSSICNLKKKTSRKEKMS